MPDETPETETCGVTETFAGKTRTCIRDPRDGHGIPDADGGALPHWDGELNWVGTAKTGRLLPTNGTLVTDLGELLTGADFTLPDPAVEYISTLPDVSGEFSGFYEVPPSGDLGPAAAAFAIGPPTFEATITLNAPEGEPYTQADADEMVGKPVRADMFPGQAPAVAGIIRTATAAEDGSEIVLIADVSPE